MKSPVVALRVRTALRTSVSALALTCASLPAPLLAAQGAVYAPEQDANLEEAQAAYQEGEQAYRLGRFDEAAESFEKAYELSDLPDILYNIGLAHLRWYDVDPQVSHLRKARVVLQNYILEVQKDPELGDLTEAETMIAEIDEKIAAVQAAEAVEDKPPEREPIDPGPDPGKKLRLAGSITMGVGGAFVVAGVVSGVVLGVRGQEFEQDLTNAYATYEAQGCMTNDTRPECQQVEDEIATIRDNGQLANALAVGLGLSLGGIGVIGVVSGAVLFVQGNKKTQRWEKNQLTVAPSFGGSTTGLTISGKF